MPIGRLEAADGLATERRDPGMAKPPKNGGGSGAATPPAGALVGTSGDDIIDPTTSPVASTAGDDVIWALDGNDVIDGSDGNDTIEAGAGDDTVYGGDGDDIVNGGDGSDVIFNGAGNDTIDGGAGIDTVVYDGVEGVDYDVVVHTTTVGKGKNARDVVSGYTVTALDGSGDVDEITNVEELIFVQYPTPGTIITQGDFETVQFDGSATIDVLANDYLEGGNPGEGLTITAILDVQIDLDGDGVNDLDLIPDTAETDISYFTGGGLLNDGSILTLNADGTLTWDPNGQYDTQPGIGEDPYVVQFWYEGNDEAGAVDYGDVTFQVAYPAQAGDIQFEDMVGLYDDFTADLFGWWIYQDGPNGEYLVSQLTSADLDGMPFEKRDEGAMSFDYDLDGDDEFRIWTDADGTTHEMNITRADQTLFDLGGLTFGGLDAGEAATVALWDGSGNYAEITVTEADLDANGVLSFTNANDLSQFSVVAGAGDSFYVDDVFLL